MSTATTSSPTPLDTNWNYDFVNIASNLTPTLHHWRRRALAVVQFVPDEAEFFAVRPVPVTTDIADFERQIWGTGEQFVLDFGIHVVGSVSMHLDAHLAHMDAPCRLRLTYGESPLDVTMDMQGVETTISSSWLPDEVINIDNTPSTVRISRRQAFRYLRVEILATSPKYKVSFLNVECLCVSSVSQDLEIEIPKFKTDLLKSIDQVSMFTLRDCMQEVFEDGPRRDRRLWIGDLRLQALANYATFKDCDLVKRCLYQFAAVARADGSVPACIFHVPKLSPSTDYIVDYDALFAATVEDYVVASGDLETGKQLWPTVLGCLKRPLAHVDSDTGMFDCLRAQGFKFLDWQKGLDRNAGCHGLLLYCLKSVNRLANLLGDPAPYEAEVKKMTNAVAGFLDAEGNVVSGSQSQRSFASVAWLTLSGALPEQVARAALLNTLIDPQAIRPLTPYLWHHVCDALASVGCYEECMGLITEYWGGMLEAGADTFWEAFDPDNARASPYGDVRNNSFCHAWSCTPTYLLRVKLAKIVIMTSKDDVGKTTMRALDREWITQSYKDYR
ncbi:glycoside hydrolase family 78 protein [Aureobasidium subglaciale EXF-2481]|uniref:Glycoside hydrolase family 78 protein n=1 Tax=Aureobasidium subglaciale (strain EXF-2481) TaxID=1043005 RepID=A0A074YER3_AURSE|nr:glycoside hydrolase family 78 protein [Aureobasidium subglaciale EXF-2481]KAI5197091.1 hypothetical protein E4T38_08162 [Aureobasidium subglaciale]KAI5215768.1 hypothetical protein E4T40_08172 [Aureobasidium subglaciale]KAI5219034.1 hypothetical protein E4T41_08087 [Aureobasidium subglaciale]KAI5256599.1 hypothetical protein E4T46_08063 [Aureobasidium subglaciale]KEQ92587.1 glycoside hydrolase family 78 protein [Aureobasidium subglaciale EXF-2481]